MPTHNASKNSKRAVKVFVYVPSLKGGGAERVAVNLVNALARMGIDVWLIIGTDVGEYWDAIDADVQVVRMGYVRAVLSAPDLLSLVWRERPDAILSTLKAANAVLAMLKPLLPSNSVVAIREASLYKGPTNLTDYIYDKLQRLSYRRADLFVANSAGTMASFLSSGIRLPKRKMIIPNPIFETRILSLADEPCRHPWVTDKHGSLIVGIGRLVPEKGFDVLLEAVAILKHVSPRIRCLVLGEGSERTALLKKAADLKVADIVEFPGFQANPYSFLKHADVFVLPSKSEGFGNVIVEALALNVPVVAADCPGGPTEILEGGRWGILCPVGDAVALAEAMEKVLSNADYPSDSGRRARDFSVEEVARKYLTSLCELDPPVDRH